MPGDGGQLLEYVIEDACAVRFISGRKNAFQNIGGRRIHYAIRDKLPQESSGPVDSPIADGAAERQEHGNQCIDNRLVQILASLPLYESSFPEFPENREIREIISNYFWP